MITKNTLTVTKDFVVIKTQKYVLDGDEYPYGDPHFCTVSNSARGRQTVRDKLSGNELEAVMIMWGDAPTV